MKPQRIPADYRNPYSLLNQQRAIELAEAVREMERELCLRLDAVQRAALMHALERFAERWPKERRW